MRGLTLYHATERERLPAILAEGLRPELSQHADDEYMNAAGLGPPYHFIYLSHSPVTAARFAPGGASHRSGDVSRAVLLQVRLPRALAAALVLDRGEFVRAPFPIPPRHLRVVSRPFTPPGPCHRGCGPGGPAGE